VAGVEVLRGQGHRLKEAKQGWEGYIRRYNTRRFHQSLGNKTPAQVVPKPVLEKDAPWIEALKTVSSANPQLPHPFLIQFSWGQFEFIIHVTPCHCVAKILLNTLAISSSLKSN